MIRFVRSFAVVVVVAACGSKSPPPKPVPPPPPVDPIPQSAGPACGVVADHAVTVMLADNAEGQPKAKEVLRTRCEADKWSDDARNCIATAQSEDEMDGCGKHLTEAQKTAVQEALHTPAAGDDEEVGKPPED